MDKEIIKIQLTYKLFENTKIEHNSLLNEQNQRKIGDVIANYPNVWSLKSKDVLGTMSPASENTFATVMKAAAVDKTRDGCKYQITSGNDSFHQNKKKEDPKYNSLHVNGQAIDVTTEEKCRAKLKTILDNHIPQFNGLSYCDEYQFPSRKSTGGHFHISYVNGKPEFTKPCSSPEIPVGEKSFSQYRDPYMASMLGGTLEKVAKPVTQQIVNPLLKKFSVTENFEFGANSEIDSSGNMIIKANSGKIKSPISGEVIKKYSLFCKNQIIIKSENEDYSIQFCGITDPNIFPKKINKGYTIGTSTKDVEVNLLSKVSSKVDWNSKNANELINPTKSYKSKERYRDRLIPDLTDLILSPFKDETGNFDFVSPTSGKLPEPWRGVTQKKLNEDLQRIKKLLK